MKKSSSYRLTKEPSLVRCTDKTISFIKKNKDNPFFVYVPHSMPHIPLYVPDEIRDPNPLNAYTCVIEHIDSEVGRIIKTIKDLKLDKNTISYLHHR